MLHKEVQSALETSEIGQILSLSTGAEKVSEINSF
jgi:hypothetical protein